MKRRIVLGTSLLLGLALSSLDAAQSGITGEPLPDASLVAYSNRPKMPPKLKISDVTLTGVIVDAQPSGLTIKGGKSSRARDQKQWLVLSQAGSTSVTIHGMATLDYLRHGQIIEFSGQIVDNTKVADKVKELTIVANKKGLASLHNSSAAKDHPVDPAIASRTGASKRDAESESIVALADEPKAGDDDKPEAAAAGPKTKIAGRIAAHDEKTLTVTVGERTIHVELADMPTIHVELSDPKMVKIGSKFEIQGVGASGRLVTLTPSDLLGSDDRCERYRSGKQVGQRIRGQKHRDYSGIAIDRQEARFGSSAESTARSVGRTRGIDF